GGIPPERGPRGAYPVDKRKATEAGGWDLSPGGTPEHRQRCAALSALPTCLLALPNRLFGSLRVTGRPAVLHACSAVASSPGPRPDEAARLWTVVPRAAHLG